MCGYPQLKKALWLWLAAMWSASAWAAEAVFVRDITSIPVGAIAVAMILAFIGGLAFTTQKIAKPEVLVRSIPIEIFKDLINSLVAGLVAFFLGSWAEVPVFAQALLITIAGYGGSRFLEQVLTESLSRVSVLINGNKKPE
jgi:uncharacterized membrane protein